MRQTDKIINSVNNLRVNVSDFIFPDNKYQILVRGDFLDKGGSGEVYILNKKNGNPTKFVVKRSDPCANPKLRRYCNDLSEWYNLNSSIIIPSGRKYRYILPNIVSESIIGAFLKNMINFSPTLGTVITDRNNINFYTIMNKYTPIKNILNTFDDYLFLIFQISHGLLLAQQKFLFTHYDLHIDNVLFDRNRNDIDYSIPNSPSIRISKDKCNFIVKITDYGLSRLETDNVLITPLVSDFPQGFYGEFNPSYDIVSFLGSILFDHRSDHLKNILLGSRENFLVFLNFILWIFNEDQITEYDQMIETAERIAEKYYRKDVDGNIIWRPNNPKNNKINIKYINTKSMSEIVMKLSDIMIQINLISQNNFSNNETLYNNFDPIIGIEMPSLPDKPDVMNTDKYNYIETDIVENRIRSFSMSSIFTRLSEKYMFTDTDNYNKTCPFQNQFITAILVDKKTPGKFTSECCMLDPINYLRMNKFTGFVINGGFFNIKRDYLPIGPYGGKNVKQNYPIPDEYQDTYGVVGLRGNKLSINRYRDISDVFNKYDQFFVTGPYLIENSKIVFDPNQKRFTCVNPDKLPEGVKIRPSNNQGKIIIERYKNYINCKDSELIETNLEVADCSKINPGELSHSDNPNPRSAICILENGDYLFITIEGRNEKGVGADLLVFSEFIMENYKVKTAINLDGGRSSVMAWRKENDNNVYVSNSERLYQYPVGNILTFKYDS